LIILCKTVEVRRSLDSKRSTLRILNAKIKRTIEMIRYDKSNRKKC